MNPALSVIAFTTLSGAGYGLLAWTALAALLQQPARPLLLSLLLALGLVTAGLLSSLGHLGQPQRAWRAVSQWRTSWLSREGVASLATYVPALGLATALLPAMIGGDERTSRVALGWAGVACALALILLALATVACTAMIYASLKPVPAWRHRLVLPVYLLFALYCGGLLALGFAATGAMTPACVLLSFGALALAACKWRYWHAIDAPLPLTRGDAVGLPAREVALFERPMTESNYITREMAFVVARKHARRLRTIALVLVAVVPVACLAVAAGADMLRSPLCIVAAASALAGAFVERWLFFAQARHLVTLYY
ncbi:MAG: dimethyl sulfoxide reductase anchor subunit family protein [Luteimonas sp.]